VRYRYRADKMAFKELFPLPKDAWSGRPQSFDKHNNVPNFVLDSSNVGSSVSIVPRVFDALVTRAIGISILSVSSLLVSFLILPWQRNYTRPS